jgi:hypothetical protein
MSDGLMGHPAPAFCLRMVFLENRFPLFRITRLFAHGLLGNPVSTFPDHALRGIDSHRHGGHG